MIEQKLKLLFGYFMGFKTVSAKTTILLDRSYIEDWDGKFVLSSSKVITPVSSIEKIIEELIEIYYSEFRRYINFEYDDYWYLYITIYPKEKELIFEARCKEEEEEPFNEDYNYENLDEERQEIIDYLYSEFSDFAKINFSIWGRWGDGEVFGLNLNSKEKKINGELDDKLWNFGNYCMKKIRGKFWNDEAGANVDITIWGDDIFVKGKFFKQDYEDTGMLIRVTPDNIFDIFENN